MAKKDGKVGYRKPPTDTQYKKGVSGNPSGRPKGRRGLRTDIRRELDRLICITEGGRRKWITKQRALAKNLVNVGLTDKGKSLFMAANLLLQFCMEDEAPTQPDTSHAEAEAIAFFEKVAEANGIKIRK